MENKRHINDGVKNKIYSNLLLLITAYKMSLQIKTENAGNIQLLLWSEKQSLGFTINDFSLVFSVVWIM